MKAEDRLYELWGGIRDLQGAIFTLEWDQETHMPPGGLEARGQALATLTGLRHRLLTAPELSDVLTTCAEAAEPGSVLEAQVRTARREVDRAVKVPEELEKELARAQSTGLAAWRQAREQDDHALFADALARMVELKRRQALALAPAGTAYDALLDDYEPGMTEAQLTPLFEQYRVDLAALVSKYIGETEKQIDESPAHGRFPEARQLAFGRHVAEAVGYRFEDGRLDLSTHPFCIGIARGDVRMTWRYQEDDFRPAFFGVLHETGHALYEQGLPEEHDRTPLAQDAGTGVHESQSRLWENHVGRSRGFWRWALPRFRETFPEAHPGDLNQLWPTFHVVRPSLIRVEADEVTYGLHVIVRYELERALFAGELEAADLRDAWNDRYEDLLGLRPEHDQDGVLQDIHWAMGLFGYFPTYALGSMMAAQLYEAAAEELGDLEGQFAEGEFAPLLGWLRKNVHRHGARYTAPELMKRVTGEPPTSAPLLRHLRRHLEAVYGP